MEQEVWKPVSRYEGLYEVSSFGRIRSLDRPPGGGTGQRSTVGRILRPYVMARGYHQASLSRDGEREKKTYHVLVAEAFIGPRPDGMHVCHNDGDPSNNRPDNLRYDSAASNARDRIIHRTVPRGEQHHHAKLTDYDVAAIRTLAEAGFEGRYISKLFDVSETAVSKIKDLKARINP